MNLSRLCCLCGLLVTVSFSITTRATAQEYSYLLRTRANPYWNTVAEGIRDAAREHGVNAQVYQVESDISAEEQLNACLAAIERTPTLLAVAAVSTSAGIQCLRKAAARGIRVGDIDSSIPLADADKAQLSLAFSVGSDNFEIGRSAAAAIKQLTKSDSPTILVLEGAPGSDAGIKRVGGFREQLPQMLPKAQVVASLSAHWDRMKALSTTSDVLQRFPKLDAIYAVNDMMALGAAEAVKIAGRKGSICILGVDGTKEARESLAKGDLTATIAQLPYLIGKRTVELSLSPQTDNPREKTPTLLLTQETLRAASDPLLKYLR